MTDAPHRRPSAPYVVREIDEPHSGSLSASGRTAVVDDGETT